MKQKYSFSTGIDIPAISTVLIARVVYLVLRPDVSNCFLKIDLDSSQGWSRIEVAIASLVQATMS
jgi:hypothetical protein